MNNFVKSTALVAFLCLLLSWFAVGSSADAQSQPESQPDIELDFALLMQAAQVVNGHVTDSQTFQFGDMPYTVQQVQVDAVLRGQAHEIVHIALAGGTRSDGTVVQVSHTPEPLALGASIQIALEPSPVDLAALITEGTGLDIPVFSVVGGNEGVLIERSDGAMVEAAASDFVFNGAARPDWAPPQEYRINASNSGLGTTATINAIRAGFTRWESDPLSLIDFTYGGQTTRRGVRIGNRITEVSFESPNATNAMSEGSLAVAHSVAGSIYEFDIVINADRLWSIGEQRNRFDIETVVAHEAGHGIGLAHSPSSDEVMFPSIPPDRIKELGAGDLNGARQLYPFVINGAITEPGHSVASNEAGQIVNVAVRANGNLLFRRDNAGGYGSWQTLGSPGWTAADVSIKPNGEAHLVATKNDGRLFTRSQSSAGVWSAWVGHGNDFDPEALPSISASASRVVLAAVSVGGDLRTKERVSAWGGFVSHGQASWTQADIAIAADGDIWFAGIKRDGRMFVRKRIGSAWSGFANQGLGTWDPDVAPAVGAYSNGVVIAATKNDGRLFTRHQIAGVWRSFAQQGAAGWAGVDVAISGNGAAWLVATKSDGRMYTRNALVAGTWRDWTLHGASTWANTASPDIAIGGAVTQPLLIAVKDSGQLWVRERSSRGWGVWQSGGFSWSVGR